MGADWRLHPAVVPLLCHVFRLLALGKHCPKLTELNLSFTRIGEPFILHLGLGEQVTAAVDLVVRSSVGSPLALTALEAPFGFLGAGCPELGRLDVEGCSISGGSPWLASLGASGGRFGIERCIYPASVDRAAAERMLLGAGRDDGAYLLRRPHRSGTMTSFPSPSFLRSLPTTSVLQCRRA